jgi:pimeloyl-ACP methyl ester carboxylesterase
MKILQIGESQLEYWDSGTGSAVVFIHGAATSGELWAADLAELAADFRLIVYNRRGYGSSSSSPRNWEAHAQDTIALIERLNAAPAVVVGYSGGSIIALHVALKRPDLVARIILLDPAFNLKRCLTPALVTTLAAVKLLRWLRGDRPAAERWLRYVSSYSTGGSAFEAKASAARRDELLANAPGIFADLASGGWSVDESRLGDISAPVTIIDAKLSPSFLRRSSHRLKRLLPQARSVTLEHSGHWVGLDARADLLKVLRDAALIASLPLSPGTQLNRSS